MSHLPKVLNALSRLLVYPDETTVGAAELLFIILRDEIPQAAGDIARFGAFAEQHEPWELEEAFTRVFDVNPACALEVGWHLFGEEYARGMFLVRMREELRRFGLSESVELPDHISHVLAIVAEMPPDEADRFVAACVQVAVEKMNQALEDKETPYRHVVACLAAVLRHTWGDPAPADDEETSPGQAGKIDLLRDYPVADVGFGCGQGCGGEMAEPRSVDIVPLQISFRPPANQPPSTLDCIPGDIGVPGNLGDYAGGQVTASDPQNQTQAPARKP